MMLIADALAVAEGSAIMVRVSKMGMAGEKEPPEKGEAQKKE